jgi:hypothetical protein
MTSINSEEPSVPSAPYISIDILDSDDESNEVITSADWAIGIAGCVGVLIVLAGATIGLLYAGKIL